MEMCDEDKSNDNVQGPSLEDKFSKLFDQLEHCNEREQKHKIEEMNGLVEEMNFEMFNFVLTKSLFDKTDKMIEEKIMSMENALLLLKHIGHYKISKSIWINNFVNSSLCIRFEQMIADENEKKTEGKNEKLLADLCECCLLINEGISSKLLSICVPCLLKVALRNEENEESQKEVEMALLALRRIDTFHKIEKELYFNEIKEIIQHHQEHRNLTQLVYHHAGHGMKN
ncbi:uncharacterized protein MONOS_18228 [Monocercomonoides exilis]|uniref:uncharacterized protein n=1 Tax=Monocercomonoides exilis TaxID=2049356 RepID=UPI00355A8C8A|nr:hypothetical protein MONOS_18228 [Monocercomonoides exilis]